MQSVLGGTIRKAGEAVSHAMSSNKKVTDMKSDIREPTTSDRLASDFGVRTGNTDIWLSASTEEFQGPQLLEDNFAREKVWLYPILRFHSLIIIHVTSCSS
jgi:catalase